MPWFYVVVAVWVGVLLVGQFRKWVWAPVRVKRKVFSLARPQWRTATGAELTAEERDLFGRFTAAFARVGFGPATLQSIVGSTSGAEGVEALMTHPVTGDIAVVLVARMKLGRSVALGVRSEFADGTRVNTASSRNIGFAPGNPAVDAVNFPWVREVPSLWEAHCRRLDRAGQRGAPRVTPSVDTLPAYREMTWAREHDWWVACGYRFLDAERGQYRSTWKGAFLSTWKLTQPVKRWRIQRRDRLARAHWADLGMDRWTPPEAEPVAAIAVAPDPTDDGSPLRYEAALREGEVRHERAGDALTIRCGGPTVGRILLRSWGKLLSAVFFTGIICITSYVLWSHWQWLSALPVNARWQIMGGAIRHDCWYLLLWTALLAWDLFQIVRAVRQARGTITFTASPAGLHFENLAGAPRRGHLARDDIHGLSVVRYRAGFAGKRYKLDVLPTAGTDRRVTLLRSRSAAPLAQVKNALLAAMGMTVAPEPATV